MSRVKTILFALVTTVMLFLCGYLTSPIIYIGSGSSDIINPLGVLYTPILWPIGIILGATLCLIGKKFLKFGIWVTISDSALLVCAAIIELIHRSDNASLSGDLGNLVFAIITFLITFLWGRSILKREKKQSVSVS